MVKITYIAAAAVNLVALVGGATAAPTEKRASTSFWYANLNHTNPNVRGFAPDLDGDLSYSVYKEVTPGGGGAAIQAAINDGTAGAKRHGQWLASQPRVVYIPPGDYIIDKTIKMNTDTVLMGDATSPPVLKAAPGFSDPILLSGQDPTTDEKGELSFAVSLKNLVLDTTNIAGGKTFTALWWGVAQAGQLQNVKIRMPPSVNGNGHTGIRLGRGSTLGLGDVRIENGQNGIWHDGHQQVLYHGIYLYQNTVGILISSGSTISIVDTTFHSVGTAVRHTGGYPWIGLIDATSINSGVTFQTTTYPSFLIENLKKDTTSNIVEGPDGFTLAAQPYLSRFSYANTVGQTPVYGPDHDPAPPRPAALAPGGGHYPSIPAPNYADLPASAFLNIKDPAQNGGHTIYGDGARDESAPLNAILRLAARQEKIAYFPFGKYRVDSTLLIPSGSRVVGEAWATITGSGPFFGDAAHPEPVVMVGRPGDVGVAQIMDMRFTVSQVLPGAIMLQFHIAGATPGQVALWNSLVTVGGTRGAKGVTDGCRDPAGQCRAAFLGVHLAPTSSVYVENVWNWVADHITEDFDGGSNIAAGRGVLVEATQGTWLHALGSEHWWLYQLNLRKAKNVLVTLLQSETNYDQGDNNQQLPPAPWTAEAAWGDPDFGWCGATEARCRMGPSNYINGGSDVYTYASASWAFFSGPGYQPCAGTYQCQKYMHWIDEAPSNLHVFGLCSKDAHTILRLANGTEITTAKDFTGSWPGGGGDVGRYTP
ncbi:glycoside hydrolase family 55 protein [Lasiosphaeris hirsuta]|uniref:Glycoside hydrolase family 55 protein n=1 Tax=Lasiosphaeris hirsuta TaxID=260670 RepID=A0AA40AZR0_9PEZI|nr:glycoside hydrolase family 55 protein [Lasiosphaeris hirsuta]